jgi:anion-transporting  ArsA/GET3 family ATPase
MRHTNSPILTLNPIISNKKIVVLTGAGGVGKTTLTSAIAVRAARAGRRVVCLTIDPARRLADSLGVTSFDLGKKVKDITGILGSDVRPGGQLSFCMLDPEETFAEMIRVRASSPEAAKRILSNTLYRYVSNSLTGLQEYMALEQLYNIRDLQAYDLIVLDTPPTANAIDFFTAPRRMIDALEGRLTKMMRLAYGKKGPAKVIGKWPKTVFKVISRFTGAELLDEIIDFVDALSDLFASFAERAEVVEKVLHGREVALCLVTTPDRSTLRETKDFRAHLAELGLSVDAIIFNRAHWPNVEDPPNDLSPDALSEATALVDEWNNAYRNEKTFIEQVRQAWKGLESVTVIPLLPDGASRVESLDHIAEYL